MATQENAASGKPETLLSTTMCLRSVSESPPLGMDLFGLTLFAIWNSFVENSETWPGSSDPQDM